MDKINYEVLRIGQDVDEKQFIKNALNYLANSENTPADIFDGEFGSVKCKENEFLWVDMDAKVTVSYSAGYDRKEEYEEWNNVSNKFDKKTRKVTDWCPVTGENKSSESVVVDENLNGTFPSTEGSWSGYLQGDLLFSEDEIDVYEVSDTEKRGKFSSVSQSAIDEAKKAGVELCFDRVKLQGDRQEKEKHSGVAEVTGLTKYVVPMFSLGYKYKDEQYYLSGMAYGSHKKEAQKIGASYPDESLANIKESSKVSRWIMFASLFIMFVSFALAYVGVTVGFIICLAISIIGLLVGSSIFTRTKKKIVEAKKHQKLEGMQKVLKKFNLSNDNAVKS